MDFPIATKKSYVIEILEDLDRPLATNLRGITKPGGRDPPLTLVRDLAHDLGQSDQGRVPVVEELHHLMDIAALSESSQRCVDQHFGFP